MEAGTYAIRLQAHGERRFVSLREANKRQAAKLAMELHKSVVALGWDRGLAQQRGELPVPKSALTLGLYLAEVATTEEIHPRTLRTYSSKVRRIAAELESVRMPRGKNKFDHVNGGAKVWQDLVDSIPLRTLSPDAVLKWQATFLAQFRGNPAKHAAATKTANSCIRAGKAIFSDRILGRLRHLSLPQPLPFSGIKALKEKLTRYKSEIADPQQLLVSGMAELAEACIESEHKLNWTALGKESPCPTLTPIEEIRAARTAFRKREAFKVLILGLSAGLRRAEIDRLQWSQIDASRRLVLIHATDCFAPKANSSGEIPIDLEIVELLEGWRSQATSRFVVEGVDPSPNSSIHHYRADPAHVELIRWLKSKGITARNPLHSLRKEFGSIVCQKAGVYVASRLLRHSSITMTASVYTDERGAITSGLGASFGFKTEPIRHLGTGEFQD